MKRCRAVSCTFQAQQGIPDVSANDDHYQSLLKHLTINNIVCLFFFIFSLLPFLTFLLSMLGLGVHFPLVHMTTMCSSFQMVLSWLVLSSHSLVFRVAPWVSVQWICCHFIAQI